MIMCLKRSFILSFVLALIACEPNTTRRPNGESELNDAELYTDYGALNDFGLLIDHDQTLVETDFRLLDQGFSHDMLSEPDADPWLNSPCQTAATPLLSNPEVISELSQKYTIKTGQALGQQKLMIHQVGDRGQNREYLSLIGNQLSLRDAQGQLIWEQSTPGLSHLHGLYDFNGDAVLEILASSSQKVYLYNLATGVEVWHSEPEDLGLGQALTTVYSVKVSQVFDELFPYLYISDAGCSTAGTGYGIIYRFLSGFNEVDTQVISEPRQAGRCAKWHTLRRKDRFSSQDEVYVLLTDQRGLHAFSAESGERILCGAYGQELVAGALPYKSLNNEQSWSWVSVLNEQISYLGIRPYQEDDSHCESDEEVIAPMWQLGLVNTSPRGLVNIDLNADGLDEIWVNHYADDLSNNGEPQWMSSIIDGASGRILARLSNMAVLSHLSWSINDLGESSVDILVSLSPNPAWPIGDIASDFQVIRVNLNQFNPNDETANPFNLVYQQVWDQSLNSVKPIWQKSALTDSPEFKRILKMTDEGETYLIFKRVNHQEQNDNHEQLISISVEGIKHELGSTSGWAYLDPLCEQTQNCDSINLVKAVESNGSISVLDHHLQPESTSSDPIELVTGINAFSLYLPDTTLSPRLATLSEVGQLSVFSLEESVLSQEPAQALWTRSFTALANSQELGPHKPFITSGAEPKVIACQRRDPTQSSWLALDLESGNEIWRHSLPSALWYSENQYFARKVMHNNQSHDLVFRVERALSPEAISSLPNCEGVNYEYVHSTLFSPSLDCPELITTPRVIHALNANDGSCLWRVILQENNPCSRPSLQNLSLLDLDQDGSDELYYLESDTLRVFNPVSGELIESEIIPQRPDSRLVSGGWLKAFEGALLRFGTFSPPDLYEAPNQSDLNYPLSTLEALWLGRNIDGVRNQSWLRSWAVTTMNGIWLRLGLNRPLIRYNAQGELDTILGLSVNNDSQYGLELQVNRLEPEQILSSTATITGLNESSAGGIIATSNEGGLFILDQDGTLQWGRHFKANPNLPLFSDWDADDQEEWLLGTDNGEITLYDQDSYQGITDIWESPCNQSSQCTIIEDIDRFILGRNLCIAWTPLAGTQNVELQLQTKAGTALSEWFEAELSDRFIIRAPNLVANNEYRIAIRAWINDESGAKIYTAISYSDGFIAIDDEAPQVSVELDRELLLLSEVSQRPLQITINAFDTVRLAGWNLLVYSAQNNLISIIASVASTQQSFNADYMWYAKDRFDNLVDPGRYKVVFTVSDDGGQQSISEAWLTVE